MIFFFRIHDNHISGNGFVSWGQPNNFFRIPTTVPSRPHITFTRPVPHAPTNNTGAGYVLTWLTAALDYNALRSLPVVATGRHRQAPIEITCALQIFYQQLTELVKSQLREIGCDNRGRPVEPPF